MKFFTTALLTACFTLIPFLLSAQVQFELEITVVAEGGGDLVRQDIMTVCFAANSVDDITTADPNDHVLPPIPPSGYDVRMRNPNQVGRFLEASTDCRSLPENAGDSSILDLIYQPGPIVDRVTLSWDDEKLRSTPALGGVQLSDQFGGAVLPTIDMASNSSFSIASEDTGFDLDIRLTFNFAAPFLPVELTNFEASAVGFRVDLNWTTASETNNSGFEIHSRSQGDSNWINRGFVEGHGSTLEAQYYGFSVRDLRPGIHHFRLKQIDFDGAFEFHPIIELVVDFPNTYSLSSAYPNPFNPSSNFTLILREKQEVQIDLVDALGTVQQVIFDGVIQAGNAKSFTIRAEGLSTGIYFYRARGEYFQASKKVVLLR